jgi:hypothetical protein
LSTAILERKAGSTESNSPALAALGKLGIVPFSEASVKEYMDRVQKEEVAKAPSLVRAFRTQPTILVDACEAATKIRTLFWTALGASIIAMIGASWWHYAISSLMLPYRGIMIASSVAAIASIMFATFCDILEGLFMAYKSEINDLTWHRETLKTAADVPGRAMLLAARLTGKLGARADFVVHQLGPDPLLELRYHNERHETESYFVYGWDGDHRLLEIDGRLVKTKHDWA